MAIIQQRVASVATDWANEVKAPHQEFVSAVGEAGLCHRRRLWSDYLSGRSDQVISEIEAESVGQIAAAFGQMMSNPNLAQWLGYCRVASKTWLCTRKSSFSSVTKRTQAAPARAAP